jgi:DNA-binding winged helix-turn-helix (wHTH) protein
VHVERIVLGNTSLDLLSAELRRTEEGAGAGAAGVGAAGAAKVGTEATATRKAGEEGVHLSQREFELCRLLMAHPKQTLTKANLLARVWGLDTSADENNVEIYISFLRKKLSYLQSNLSIITVRGMGYRLEVPGTGASEVAESTEGKSAATAEPGATPASPTEPVAPAPPTTPLTTPTPPQTGNPHAH